MTDLDWRMLLLDRLGAPATGVNMVALSAWADSERIPERANNPLGCTLAKPGSALLNSSGVRVYSDIGLGIGATAELLGHLRFEAIAAALRRGDSLAAIYEAINASTWCTGCGQRRYPATLAAIIDGVTVGDMAVSGSPEPTGRGVTTRDDDPSDDMRVIARAWTEANRRLDGIIAGLGRM